MYAVVAPGFSCIYTNWESVERIKALYPYPKWTKVSTEEEAHEWIKRNKYGRHLNSIYNYGNTFDKFYINVHYRILNNYVYYVLDCSRVGDMRINNPGALVEYKGRKIYVKQTNMSVSNETVAGHMSALHNLLSFVGDYIDLNIELDYYSLYYCLTVYSRNRSRPIRIVKEAIKNRLGAVAFSLKLREFSDEEATNDD